MSDQEHSLSKVGYDRPPKDSPAGAQGAPVGNVAAAAALPAMLADDAVGGIHWIQATSAGMMPQRVGAVLQFDFPRLAPEP